MNGHTRRNFLGRNLAAATASLLRCAVPYARFMPIGYVPLALADADAGGLPGKPGLRVLNDRPLNAETPAHLLDDEITPASRLFVRNNGIVPEDLDPATWSLRVHGESCERDTNFTIEELRSRFDTHTYALQLECGGNGRSEFRPRASGNQWTTGAVGCPEWTGVRLADVLEACGVQADAVYVAYRARDKHLSGDLSKEPISRGVPIAKAMEAESLIAFEMNGEPIPPLHGAPLRMVIGGWPGSASGKWLSEILVRDRVHDGAKMGGKSYRVPCNPVAPGSTVDDENMCIINSMPVKSLITSPKSGGEVKAGKAFEIRGHAWAGDLEVAEVAVSVDFGATWQTTQLKPPRNRLAWQRFSTEVTLPESGYYEVWAKATDEQGRSQPMLLPGWNPKGYLNNAAHRIALRAG